MKLEYLREFLVLAETLNYSAAARRLFISQSALTRHIQAMEHELNFSLVKTSSHQVALTSAGQMAVSAFQKMVKEYDGFLARTSSLSAGISGRLTLGILYYLLDECFAGFLAYFRAKYPNVSLTCVTTYQPQPLYDDLISGRLDIGSLICYRSRVPEGMIFQKIAVTSMVAMMDPSNPLAGRESVTLEELSPFPLILLSHDEYANQLTLDMLRAASIHSSSIRYTDNIETVPYTIRASGGVHITGEHCQKQHASSIVYQPITGGGTTCQVGVAAMETDDPLTRLLFREAALFFGGKLLAQVRVVQ